MAADQNGTASGMGDNGAGMDEDHVQLLVKAQYTKDFSFENPRAPQSLMELDEEPDVDVNVNVEASLIGGNDFEVVLKISINAQHNGNALFISELEYAGVFELGESLPDEHKQPLLLIECPRILFPFARNILADAIRDGGFPPLMLQPLDFGALYQQEVMKQQTANA